MHRVLVYGKKRGRAGKAELLELLQAADCELIEDEAEDVLDEDSEVDVDCLLVIMAPELLEDPELEEQILLAVRRNCKIVGVWPSGGGVGLAPGCVNKYSADQIVWDARTLKAVFKGAAPKYQTATGEERPRPETKTNSC